MTPLNDALTRIATAFDLDAAALIGYAGEDTMGGYHTDDDDRRWPTGSIWGVEGQTLYALARALKPRRALQLGTWHGCGLRHLTAALEANGGGVALSIDLNLSVLIPLPDALKRRARLREGDALDMLPTLRARSFDLIFEDMLHTREQVEAVWREARRLLRPGGVIVSHDSEHSLVGADVRAGIAAAGFTDIVRVLIEPSDCGLALWRNEAT